MRISHTLVSSLLVILDCIELSVLFECLPNGDPILVVPRSGKSSSSEGCHQSAESPVRVRSRSVLRRAPFQSEPSLRARCRSSLPRTPFQVETSLRARSKSPPTEHNSSLRLGHVRLIPHKNPHQQFEIQEYTFPANESIYLRGEGRLNRKPLPTKERNVLTTSTGDVLAILEGNKYLRGLYATRNISEARIKINMHSGVVEYMTLEEIKDTPLGNHKMISKNFKTVNVKKIPPQ